MIQKFLISAIALLVFFLVLSELIESPKQTPKNNINVTPLEDLEIYRKIDEDVVPKKTPEIILEPNNKITVDPNDINLRPLPKKAQPSIQEEKNIPFIIGIDVVPLSHTPLFYKIKEQDGFVITKIYKGTPASESGLKVNDVILLVDNQKTYEMKHMLKEFMKDKRSIELKIWSGGERKYLNVTIY